MIYFACIMLFMTGIYCVAAQHNVIKTIIGLIIMEYSAVLFLVLFGYVKGRVDPGLQALSAVLLIAGLAATIIMTAIAVRLYDRYGTLDINLIRKLKG